MSSFLSNIIDRHTGSENDLTPRVRGVFEPRQATLGRPNIPSPLLGNEEGTADIESNSQFRLNEPSILVESTNAPKQVASNKADKKDSLVFSTRQNLQEQTRIGPIRHKGDEQAAPLLKEAASTRSMQLAQQRVLERVRFEVSKEEKGADGFSPKMPNHKGMDGNIPNRQDDLVIKPLSKTKTLAGLAAAPSLQRGEAPPPISSIKAYPKTGREYSKHGAIQNNIVSSQPSVTQPAITVHIGRIEIKAVKEAPVKQARPQMPESRLSLDEFLKKRDNKL